MRCRRRQARLSGLKKRALIGSSLVLSLVFQLPVQASVPQEDTPEYKVAFYAYDNYHEQDAEGSVWRLFHL